MKQRKGFTLIEILVVVAMIGILSSIVLVSLGPVQRRGRDAKRVSDLRNTQNALELYFTKCGYYPGGYSGSGCTNATDPADWPALAKVLQDSGVTTKVGTDPLNNSTYKYEYAVKTGRLGYYIGATLEDTSSNLFKESYTGSGITDCGTKKYCIEF